MSGQADSLSITRDRPALLRLLINGTMWSFLGVLLTVAFFYWTQYRNPFDFEITIDDEVNLVQVRDRIADLEIKYKNEDILNTPKVLKVLRVTLRNSGQTILQNQYDQTEQFGLVFKNAEVLDASVTDSNAEYLKTHFLPKTWSKTASGRDPEKSAPQASMLRLEKAIFEKGKYITLKVFLLQERNESAVISVLGKIANIDRMTVKRSLPGEEKQGVPRLPIVSFLVGYVGMIAGTFSFVFLFEAYIDKKYWRERRRKLRDFLNTHKNLTTEQRAIIAAYRSRGRYTLSEIVRRLAAGDEVLNLRDYYREQIRGFTRGPWRFIAFIRLLEPLFQPTVISKEIFLRDGVTVTFNPHNEKFIRVFFTAMGVIREDSEPPTSNTAELAVPPDQNRVEEKRG